MEITKEVAEMLNITKETYKVACCMYDAGTCLAEGDEPCEGGHRCCFECDRSESCPWACWKPQEVFRG